MPGDSELCPCLAYRFLTCVDKFVRIGWLSRRDLEQFLKLGRLQSGGRYGSLGNHRDHIVGDLNKATINVVANGLAILLESQLAESKLADHWRWLGPIPFSPSCNGKAMNVVDSSSAVASGVTTMRCRFDMIAVQLSCSGLRSETRTQISKK